MKDMFAIKKNHIY